MGPFGSLSSQSSLVDVEAVVIMFFLEEHEKLNEGERVYVVFTLSRCVIAGSQPSQLHLLQCESIHYHQA